MRVCALFAPELLLLRVGFIIDVHPRQPHEQKQEREPCAHLVGVVHEVVRVAGVEARHPD